MKHTILIDSREPWPHPWTAHFSPAVKVERGCLETDDVAMAIFPEGAVVERKTVPDLLACIGRERERFERELKRSRYVARLLTTRFILISPYGALLIFLRGQPRKGYSSRFCHECPKAGID